MVIEPDSSAVRTALWRALHVQVDPPPHILDDEIALALAAPDAGWRDRPDMHPIGTRPYRVGIVARTRYVEDLLIDEGIGQYVLLGAGLDTFAQRRPVSSPVEVFEIDQPGPQAWKRQRLEVLGYGVDSSLHLIAVDFESDADWWQALLDHGFRSAEPALVSSSGVSMYITKEATWSTLRRLAGLATGSVVAMSFMLRFELVDDAERPGLEGAAQGARASGTPWISFYAPEEIVTMAVDAGFSNARSVSTAELAQRYLDGRRDGLRAANGEAVLIART